MPEGMRTDCKNLGYMNSWGKETPEEVTKCRELGHKLIACEVGRCDTRYRCPVCNYYYNIDSGD